MKEDLIYLLGLKDAKFTAEKELEKNPCAVNAQKVFEYSKRIDEVLAKIDKDYDEFNKYKEFEKRLGCPLEVRCKITTDTKVYDVEGNSFEVSYIHDNNFSAIMNYGFGSRYDFDFAYSDYKITWFLKKDRSE